MINNHIFNLKKHHLNDSKIDYKIFKKNKNKSENFKTTHTHLQPELKNTHQKS